MTNSSPITKNDLDVAVDHAERAFSCYSTFSSGIRGIYSELCPEIIPKVRSEMAPRSGTPVVPGLKLTPMASILFALHSNVELHKTIASALREEVLQLIEDCCLGVLPDCPEGSTTWHLSALEVCGKVFNIAEVHLLGSQEWKEFLNPKPFVRNKPSVFFLGPGAQTANQLLNIMEMLPQFQGGCETSLRKERAQTLRSLQNNSTTLEKIRGEQKLLGANKSRLFLGKIPGSTATVDICVLIDAELEKPASEQRSKKEIVYEYYKEWYVGSKLEKKAESSLSSVRRLIRDNRVNLPKGKLGER